MKDFCVYTHGMFPLGASSMLYLDEMHFSLGHRKPAALACLSCLKTVLYCNISMEGKTINQTVYQDWTSSHCASGQKTLIFMDSICNPHQRQPLHEGGTMVHSILLQSVSKGDIPLSMMLTASIWFALCRDKNSFVFQEQGMFTLWTWSILMKCLNMCS